MAIVCDVVRLSAEARSKAEGPIFTRETRIFDALLEIVGIILTEKFCIDHNTTVNLDLDYFAFHYGESTPTVVSMMSTHKTDKFSAAFNKLSPSFLRSWMTVQRERQERVDPLHAMEFRDINLNLGLTELFPIKFQNTGGQIVEGWPEQPCCVP